MHRIPRLVLALLALGPAARAQVTAHVTVEDPITARVDVLAGSLPQAATVPAGALGATAHVVAATSRPGGPESASVSVWAVPQPLGATVAYGLEAHGRVGTIGGFPSSAMVQGTLRVTLDGTGAGDLLVSVVETSDLSSSVVGSTTLSGPALPSSIMWTLPLSGFPRRACQRVPVSVAGSTHVDVTLFAVASSATLSLAQTSDYKLGVDVQFVPAQLPSPATALPTDEGCGPVLVGTDDIRAGTHALRFTVSEALPHAPLVLVFGLRGASLPLQGACTLLTEPVNALLVFADASGTAAFALTLPASVPTAALLMQGVAFDASGTILASNLLRVGFGDC